MPKRKREEDENDEISLVFPRNGTSPYRRVVKRDVEELDFSDNQLTRVPPELVDTLQPHETLSSTTTN